MISTKVTLKYHEEWWELQTYFKKHEVVDTRA